MNIRENLNYILCIVLLAIVWIVIWQQYNYETMPEKTNTQEEVQSLSNNDRIIMDADKWDTFSKRSIEEVIVRYNEGDLLCSGRADNDNHLLYPFEAFPLPGYFPTNTLDYDDLWQVELNTNMVSMGDIKDIRVYIKNLNDETVIKRVKDSGLSADGSILTFKGPEILENQYSGDYRVEISGLCSTLGTPLIICYTVKFFNINDYGMTDISQIDYGSSQIYASSDMKGELVEEFLPKEITAEAVDGSRHVISVDEWARRVSGDEGLQEDVFMSVLNEADITAFTDESADILRSLSVRIVRYDEKGPHIDIKEKSEERILSVSGMEGMPTGIEWYALEENKEPLLVGNSNSLSIKGDDTKKYAACIYYDDTKWLVW